MTVNVNNSNTIQSQMDIHMGHSPAIEASSRQIDNIAWRMNVVAKTASYDVLARDSGTMFTTFGATDIEFTLPTPVDGLIYWFYSAVDDELLVSAHTNGAMIAFNNVAADSIKLTTDSEQIGSCFICFTDGTTWFAAPMIADAAATIVVT